MEDQKFLVLFPGAWGNQTREDVEWWFDHMKPLFGGYKVVRLTYEGKSIEEIAWNVRHQLRRAGVPHGSRALCYSMGSQVLRAVMATDHAAFSRAIFVSGLERGGIRLVSFAHIVLVAFWSFVASLVTGRVIFRSVADCRRVMFSGEAEAQNLAQAMLAHMKVEPMWMKIAQVFLPGFRKTFPPLRIPVQAIVPSDDLIVAGSKYKGENVRIVNVTGTHAFIRHGSTRFEATISQAALFLSS